MYIYLTEEAAEIWLTEEEVQTLVKGEMVMGSPDTAFLSPFGMRPVFVRQAGMEEIKREKSQEKITEEDAERMKGRVLW